MEQMVFPGVQDSKDADQAGMIASYLWQWFARPLRVVLAAHSEWLWALSKPILELYIASLLKSLSKARVSKFGLG